MKLKIKKENILKFAKKRKTEILIVLAILIVAIISTVIIVNKNKSNRGNSISNLQNKGIATANGSTAYYNKFGKKIAIYKLGLNSNKETKIKNTEGYYLNLYKNSLFYLEQEEGTNLFNIIKSKLDGSEREKLVREVDNNVITVADGWVYYFKDKVLYRIKTNGKDNMKVIEDVVLNYGINKNFIYFIYNNGERNILARKNLHDGSLLKLAENVTKDFEIIGNKIYFIDQKYNTDEYDYNYSLYRMKLDGRNRKQILSLPNSVENINITKHAIFYAIDNNNAYNIYKLKYKETEPTLVKETRLKPYIVNIGEWIFYSDLNDNQEMETFRIKGE